tara:strand:+ start:964 stop:1668 length:705 start_codon:yes stop_codon:yes gene_type:complete
MYFSIVFSQDFSRIDNQINNKNFRDAQLILLELNEEFPKNIDILTRLSIVHHFISESSKNKSLKRENSNKAFEYIKDAYNIAPENPKVLKWYVISLGKTVENKSIRKQIEESKNIEKISLAVIKELPDDEYCYNILGQWHYRLADLNGPSRRIASLLFTNPPEGSFEKAKFFLEQSIKINPEYIGTYYWLGKTYIKLGDTKKANELFRQGVVLERPFKREEDIFIKMNKFLKNN